jgi:hypothetical protein
LPPQPRLKCSKVQAVEPAASKHLKVLGLPTPQVEPDTPLVPALLRDSLLDMVLRQPRAAQAQITVLAILEVQPQVPVRLAVHPVVLMLVKAPPLVRRLQPALVIRVAA